MALSCPVCRSDDAQHLAGDLAQCRSCDAHFEVSSGEVQTVSFGGSELPTPKGK